MIYQLLRFFIFLLPWGTIRTKWIVRFRIFHKVGDNFFFCPRKLPADPKLIEFGSNVAVATDVMFINHDVSYKIFNVIYEEQIPKYYGCIKIGNNVFIGARVTILPDIYICDNVIIAAGALVSKSITQSGIYAGVPAKYIGDVKELYTKRLIDYKSIIGEKTKEDVDTLWHQFQNKNKEII